MQFTKLFSSILDSTIWSESAEVKVLWVTMLAMSDRNGEIHSSVPGLARRAGITLKETEDGLATFLKPDRYSRTPDHKGRRIEVIDGGWALLNHAKYRALLSAEERREYNRRKQAERRAKQKALNVNDTSMTVNRSKQCPHSTEAEAEAEAEAEKTHTHAREASPTDLDKRILRVLDSFEIKTDIYRIDSETLGRFQDNAFILDDEGLEVITKNASEWRKQAWIRDITPRLISTKLSDIYHWTPTGNGSANGSANGYHRLTIEDIRAGTEMPRGDWRRRAPKKEIAVWADLKPATRERILDEMQENSERIL
jgi:hypothetical protein